ncbi:MAG: glycosyltransferase [Cytophagales bacterium]|nr:MAG: glycosyltransferase [Cytophagales bacterium]
MENTKVSVIVATHNYGHFITEALQSVQKQIYTNWECMIVDDGSTDNTQNVVQYFTEKDARFKYFYRKKSTVNQARNYGIAQSSGAFIQFLDADDALMPDKLAKQVDFLQKNPSADVVYGGAWRFWDDATNELEEEKQLPTCGGVGEELLEFVRVCPLIHTVLMRKSIYEKNGKLEEQLIGAEDWEYWLRITNNGSRFAYEPEAMVKVRRHANSTTQKHWQQMYNIYLMRKLFQQYCQIPALYTLNNDLMSKNKEMLVHIALEEIQHKKPNAVGHLWKTARLHQKIRPYLYLFLAILGFRKTIQKLIHISFLH